MKKFKTTIRNHNIKHTSNKSEFSDYKHEKLKTLKFTKIKKKSMIKTFQYLKSSKIVNFEKSNNRKIKRSKPLKVQQSKKSNILEFTN